MRKRAVELRFDSVSHKRKSDVVGVAGIYRTHILIFAAEERCSVNIIHVLVSVCACSAKALKDIYISRFVAVRYLPHPKNFVKKDKEKLKKVLTKEI